MKLLLFNFRCAKCNNQFTAPSLPDGAYGEFLLISENGETVYLNSFKDGVFDELRSLFKKHEKNFKKIDKYNEAKIFQAVFSITCDKSPSDGTYHIGGSPVCPKCKSREMASYGETNPPKFISEDIKLVAHENWNKLSLEEKELRTETAIKEVLEKQILH